MKRGKATGEVITRVNNMTKPPLDVGSESTQPSGEPDCDVGALSLQDKMKWLEPDVIKKVVWYFLYSIT